MKTIEEYIHQQKKFTSTRRKLLVNLVYTGNYIADQMDEFFNKHDLTYKQYNVLRILKGAKQSLSTSCIKSRMLVKNADASRIVDRLMKKGLVIKETNSEDKRMVSVSLSSKGQSLIQNIESNLHELDQNIQNLSIIECEKLNYLLDKLKSLNAN